MSRNNTKRRGRATICWGLEFDDEPDRPLGWSDREPDLYIFPGPAGADCRRDAILAHCTEGLAAHVHVLWKQATDPVVRQSIASRLTAMPIAEALSKGATARDDWFATSPRNVLLSWLTPDCRRPEQGDIESLPVLDDLVKTLKDRDDVAFDPLALTHMAFHAGFNPVIVCPPAFALGELLSIAAWTGMLCRGRTVMMPKFVASYWLMLLDEAGGQPPSWEPDAFLLQKAASIVGLDLIRKTSRAVCQMGPLKIRRQNPQPSRLAQNAGFENQPLSVQFQAACSETLGSRSVSSSRV